jgi:hypothetical protein
MSEMILTALANTQQALATEQAKTAALLESLREVTAYAINLAVLNGTLEAGCLRRARELLATRAIVTDHSTSGGTSQEQS